LGAPIAGLKTLGAWINRRITEGFPLLPWFLHSGKLMSQTEGSREMITLRPESLQGAV
jgi:hypothetical protein